MNLSDKDEAFDPAQRTARLAKLKSAFAKKSNQFGRTTWKGGQDANASRFTGKKAKPSGSRSNFYKLADMSQNKASRIATSVNRYSGGPKQSRSAHRSTQNSFKSANSSSMADINKRRSMQKSESTFLLVVENFSEAVNPVYRRRRLAKIMQRSRFYNKHADHWTKVSDTLDKQSDKLNRDHRRKYGDFMKATPEQRKIMNAEHSKLNARRGNAEDQVIKSSNMRGKAYRLAKGSYTNDRSGQSFHRVRPANPLRKNRDEEQHRHSITMDKALSWRKKSKAKD